MVRFHTIVGTAYDLEAGKDRHFFKIYFMQKEEALDNDYFQHIKDEFDKYGIAYHISMDESDRECINVDCKSYEKAIRDSGHVKEQMDELFKKSKWEGHVIHTGECRIYDRDILSWRIINKVKK